MSEASFRAPNYIGSPYRFLTMAKGLCQGGALGFDSPARPARSRIETLTAAPFSRLPFSSIPEVLRHPAVHLEIPHVLFSSKLQLVDFVSQLQELPASSRPEGVRYCVVEECPLLPEESKEPL